MNDQTGERYDFLTILELREKIEELEAKNQTLTLFQQSPDERCPCCKGTGSVQVKEPFYVKGRIRRFIPCFCTYGKKEAKDG